MLHSSDIQEIDKGVSDIQYFLESLDRGGPKDSETAPNSFVTKINEKGFWRFANDMLTMFNFNKVFVQK